MEITLKNFRCYKDHTFSFPESGLVQLAGKNGKGKTTILNAISYALFRKLKGRPYTHGTKSCTVKLELTALGLKVIRSSTPNNLKVWYKGTKYEDEAGQNVINKVLVMTPDEFAISSYVAQGINSSVISMSPVEQAAFVEKLALKSSPHQLYIEQCIEKIRLLKDDVSTLKDKCSSLKQSIKSIDRLLPPTAPPEPDVSDVNSKRSSLKKTIRKLDARVESLQQRYEKLLSLESTSNKAKSERDTLSLKLAHYTQLTDEVTGTLTEEEREALDLKIKRLESSLKMAELYTKRSSLKKLVRDFEKSLQPIRLQIEELETEVGDETEETVAEKLVSLRDMYEKYTVSKGADAARYGDAEAELSAIKKELAGMYKGASRLKKPTSFSSFIARCIARLDKDTAKLLEEKKLLEEELSAAKLSEISMECPSCESLLYVDSDHLEICTPESEEHDTEIITDSILEIDMKMASTSMIHQRLTSMLESVTRICTVLDMSSTQTPDVTEFDSAELETCESLLQSVRSLESCKKSLKVPPYICKAKREIKKISKLIDADIKPVTSVTKTESRLKTLTDRLDVALKAESNLSIYGREINKLTRRITVLDNYANSRSGYKVKKGEPAPTSTDVLQQLEESRKRVHTYKSELLSLKGIIISQKEYAAYVGSIKKRDRLQTRYESVKSRLEDVEGRLEGFKGLKQAVREAVIVAMTGTIDKINYYAAVQLEKMFEDPISVCLTGVTTTQAGKTSLKMSTKIYYEGEEYYCIDEMSQGERQRCNLAFLFAVNTMLNSGILMLDESLNNLDIAVKRMVMELLGTLGNSKLILIVSQDTVQGAFKRVIEVNHDR